MSMTAVPGNHGEAVRISGKGVTRFNDSHDTDCLLAVQEAASLSENYGHVTFHVPDDDELVVINEVAGTIIGQTHGHKMKPNKHFEWWRGQAFGGSRLNDAHILLAGHYHHLRVDRSGSRTFIQTPALESESTYFRHLTGEPGDPSLIVFTTRDGHFYDLNVLR